ncbi:MAG: transglycosylase SLT domain-containing protein [Syntrophaceae bacterium]|nr:transglycosylase SLT domain-containing protein [Syntrophaceae bacterium]
MQKAYWALFLSGFLLPAGCLGIHSRPNQAFFSSSPAQLVQEITPFPQEHSNPSVQGFPGKYALPEISLEDLIRARQEADLNFCFAGQMPLEEIEFPGSALALRVNGGEAAGSEEQEEGPLLFSLWQAPHTLESPLGIERDEGDRRGSAEPLPGESLLLAGPKDLEGSFAQTGQLSIHDEMEFIPSSLVTPGLGEGGKVPEAGTGPAKISASFPKMLNDRVKTFIDLFQNKADQFFTRSLARSQAYEGIIRPILREKNLPEELLYLALIESGYDPYAQSRAKATGIWQFMKGTAKRFGLRVDQWVDERRDPEKSTLAAADYLKSLYEMFNCWYLAAAGYNAGEGKILQAMKRAKSQDFWAISNHRYLKRETKEYVPRLLAAMIIAQDPAKYGFSKIDYHAPLAYEKVVVPSGVRLDRIARAAETNLEEVRALNPALRRDKTPPQDPSFEIKLPPGKKEAFERNFSRVFKLDPRTSKKHAVRRGETLGQIAKQYKVDLRELCEGNEITPQTLIKPGMILLLPP